jgi:hypothetical protein
VLLCPQGLSQEGHHFSADRGGFESCKAAKVSALEAYPPDAEQTPSASGTVSASTFARWV